MNKSQMREIANLAVMHKLGMSVNVALGLSALIRSAMTNKSKVAMLEYAVTWNVVNHPEFIV